MKAQPLSMRPVALEITLPSGHVESLTRTELENLIQQGKQVLDVHFPPTTMQCVIQAAADVCQTTPALMRGGFRDERVAFARWLVWSHVYECGSTLAYCGSLFDKDHGTVMHGLAKLRDVPTHGKPWQISALQEFKKRAAEIGNPLT